MKIKKCVKEWNCEEWKTDVLRKNIAGYTLLLSSPLFDCVQAHIAQMTIINIFEKKCNFDKKVAEKFGKGGMFDVPLSSKSEINDFTTP